MDPLKSGNKTSEFWLILLFFATVIANGTAYVDIPETQVSMLAALAFGFAGGRTWLKNTATKTAEKSNA